MKKKKKETLEDIIPKNVLRDLLSNYLVLKDIESKPLAAFDDAIRKFGQIDDIIQSFVKDGWIDEKASQNLMCDIRQRLEAVVLFKNYYSFEWLCMKSELETTTTTYDFSKGLDYKIVKRRQRGHKPTSLARSYLLASLCGEIKERTKKPNYRIVADYIGGKLKEAGFDSKRVEVENKRIRKNGTMIHIAEILQNYLPKK